MIFVKRSTYDWSNWSDFRNEISFLYYSCVQKHYSTKQTQTSLVLTPAHAGANPESPYATASAATASGGSTWETVQSLWAIVTL